MSHYDDNASAIHFGSLTDQVKNQAVDALKEFFVRDTLKSGTDHNGVPYDFTFSASPDSNGLGFNPASKIKVVKEFPDDERAFPCVVVLRYGMNTVEAGFGQKLGPRVNHADQYAIRGGLTQGGLQMVVASLKEAEKNLLMDIVSIAFADLEKLQLLFAKRGLNILVPHITSMGEAVQTLTNMQKAFTHTFQVQVQGMWQTFRPPPAGPIIEDIVKDQLPVDRVLTGDIFGDGSVFA